MLGAFALGKVLYHTYDEVWVCFVVAYQGYVQPAPEKTAVFSDVSLFHFVTVYPAGDESLEAIQVFGYVIGVG